MNAPDPEPTQRGPAPEQRVFGRYLLKKIIGRGGMGIVWQARDETLGEDIALKFLPDAVRWDPAALDDLKAETKRARQLTHPNIVRIHDFIEDASAAAISMELVEGKTLTELRLQRENKIFDPADIAAWLPQLCAALDYAHSAGRVVHRDLKPSNLMLTPTGALKIADFGVARSLSESVARVSMTSAGTLVYMSPQQAMGEDPAPSDDLYSLGATIYELLTGKPPFYTGDVRVQVFQRKPDSMTDRRRRLGVGGAPIDGAWERMIAACLDKTPEARPKSAAEVAARLTAPTVKKRSLPGRIFNPFRAFRRRSLLATGALVAAMGLTVWYYRPHAAAKPAGTAVTFPSDATRAYAAWNLDGDGRDASGRGLNLALARAVPTEDRHGRIDRAVAFSGSTDAERTDFPTDGWGSGKPFTVALWVKLASSTPDATLVSLHSDLVDGFYWTAALSQGRPRLTLGQHQVDHPDEVTSPEALPANQWMHVAAASDGRQLLLFVDGRKVASARMEHSHAAAILDQLLLTIGFNGRLDAARLVGALDEVRLWQRTLAPAELAQLASREPPPRFLRTQGTYPDKADLPAAVKREFGPEARLADWNEIQRWHADDTQEFAGQLGIHGETLFVQRAGQRYSKPPRQYFIDRFNGRKPDYFDVFAELGGMSLALGSWYGNTNQALASLPPLSVEKQSLLGALDGNVSRTFAQPAAGSPAAMSVSWKKEMRRDQPGEAAQARLRLRDGRELRAICAPAAGGFLTVSLGDDEKQQFSRRLNASYDRFTFTLVVKPGRLVFRAVAPLGAEPLFQESVAVADLAAADIESLVVSGVDRADLAVER